MIELAVTEVVETVAVPPTNVTLPKLLAPAAVVDATLVDRILFPAVPNTKLPFVAVIAPSVAVSVVAAVIEPNVALIFPADATRLPVVTVSPVPAVIVVVDAIVVVATMEPGAVNATGIDNVIVLTDPVDVI